MLIRSTRTHAHTHTHTHAHTHTHTLTHSHTLKQGTLAKFYEDKGPLNETLTRRYTRQILQGAEYLHERDIIHRDIKGSNIMRDTRGHIKLADFGIAKKIYAETSEDKRTSYLYGTAPWAAPEVLRSEAAQSQSDIW